MVPDVCVGPTTCGVSHAADQVLGRKVIARQRFARDETTLALEACGEQRRRCAGRAFEIHPEVGRGWSLRSQDGKDAECADTEREEHDRHDGERRPDTTVRMLPHQGPVAGDSHDEDEDGQEQDRVQRL